ncbi:Membrane protein involved in the export of O-antigen and teichoic acid [Selenomonas ruminantium]|uniref:Membrane protein involved in the export of O-antigen and teichoic acid n=1 Tax=Selenomonas ruminantium TaxID=971 RepID=A0A1I3BZ29_SELRU|nr:hypothetical protein [Selenomonas ruminantium]SFH67189.1 Membrane protein involved in the export of O-antigen and teichoic acid [Selenomonas ruminantium]
MMTGTDRIKNSSRNLVFGMLKYIVTLLCPFVIRTILIYRLGVEYAGINSLFSSILQVLSLSELGFSTVVVYTLYEPVAKKNIKRICSLLAFFKKIYKYCGLFILVMGLGLTPFVRNFISGHCPDDINIYIVFVLLLLNTSISYLFCGYKSVLFSANQRDDMLSKASVISSLVTYFLQIGALIIFENYYLFVISLLMGTLLNNVFMNIYAKKMYPEVCCKGDIETQEKKKLFKSVGALFGHQLDMVIINSADNLVISMFLGLSMIAIYNNYFYILSGILSVLIMVSNSFAGSIGNSIAIEPKEKNYKNFIDFTYFIGMISSVCVVLLFSLYQDFMLIWMGPDMILDIGIVFLICFSLYVRQFRRSLSTYKIAAGIWEKDWIKPYIAGFANLILNIILVQYIGLYGVIISTILCFCVIDIPWETVVFFQGYFKDGLRGYLKVQFRLLLKTIVIGLVAFYISNCIYVATITMLIVKFMVLLLITSVLLIICSYKDEEFKYVIRKIKPMIR